MNNIIVDKTRLLNPIQIKKIENFLKEHKYGENDIQHIIIVDGLQTDYVGLFEADVIDTTNNNEILATITIGDDFDILSIDESDYLYNYNSEDEYRVYVIIDSLVSNVGSTGSVAPEDIRDIKDKYWVGSSAGNEDDALRYAVDMIYDGIGLDLINKMHDEYGIDGLKDVPVEFVFYKNGKKYDTRVDYMSFDDMFRNK